jgi:GT2 family glycosyltransferase
MPTAEPSAWPLIRVVILNFDGGQMTIDCLDSVLASDWPDDRLQIVMVDNGSLDDVADRVRAEYPMVTVLEPLANLGFAGGCNLGMRHELAGEPPAFVALINNDATVHRGWLRALYDALRDDPGLGAAAAKMLFADQFLGVDVSVDTTSPYGGDPRNLGVRLSAVRLDGEPVAVERIAPDEGFWGMEAPHLPDGEEFAVWSGRRGTLRVKHDGASHQRIALRLSSLAPRVVTVEGVDTAIAQTGTADLGRQAVWAEVAIDPHPYDVINNAGSDLYERGFGGDRGFLQRDEGQYERPAEVFAWCGGAVLLRREYLDQVGLFDDRLFLYYEDTDLSWRGQLAGWRYRYVPDAIVRHRHAASSGVGSPTFRFYTERNRLLVLTKNAPVELAVRQIGGYTWRLAKRTVRDLFLRPLTLRLPTRAEPAHGWRVLRSYLRLAPSMVHERRAQRLDVSRRHVMRWQTVKESTL